MVRQRRGRRLPVFEKIAGILLRKLRRRSTFTGLQDAEIENSYINRFIRFYSKRQQDMERFQLNTVMSAAMKLLNLISKVEPDLNEFAAYSGRYEHFIAVAGANYSAYRPHFMARTRLRQRYSESALATSGSQALD